MRKLIVSAGMALGASVLALAFAVSGSINVASAQTSSASYGVSNAGGGGGGQACYVFSVNLGIGSHGADVVALQDWLMEHGFNIPALVGNRQAKGIYSFQTVQAVAKYQASVGIPATGYFGPLTRAAINNSCSNPISDKGIVVALDAISPLSSTVQISTSSQTQNVPLAVFDLKSQGETATLESLILPLTTNNQSSALQIFSNIQIRAGGLTYSAGSIAKADDFGDLVVSFTNMQIPMPADQIVPVTVYATVAQDTTGSINGSNVTVSLPETTNNIVAIGTDYNTVPMLSTGTASGNTITFSSAVGGVQLSGAGASLGAQTCTNTGCTQQISLAFNLTAGNQPIFLGTQVTNSISNASGTSLVFAADGYTVPSGAALLAKGTGAGDSPSYYYIAPGQTRGFGYTGTVSTGICPTGYTCQFTVKVQSIRYGTSPGSLSAYSIISGLNGLQVTGTMGGVTSNGISVSLDPVSPLPSTVQISTTAQTQNVALAVFDIMSKGQSATLRALNVNVNTSQAISNIFSNIKIKASGQVYSALTINVSNNVVSFANLAIPLPADQNVQITVYGNVAQDTNNMLDGSSAQVTLGPSSGTVSAVDSNNSQIPVITGGIISGSTITFSSSGVMLSNASAVVGAQTCNSTYAPTECDYSVSFNFTLTAGNNPVYIGRSGSCPAGYTCTSNPLQFGGNITPVIGAVYVSPGSLAGDGTNYYVIPPGTSRQFTVAGVLTNSNGLSPGLYFTKVTGISYGTDPNNTSAYSITSGLSNLVVSVTFNGGPAQQPITVNSPASGATWTVGNQYQISWNDPNMNASTMAHNIYLSGGGNAEGYSRQIGTANAGASSFTYAPTSSDLPQPGGFTWKILVCPANVTTSSNVCGLSGSLNIIAPAQQPTITITSPSGGQAFIAGQSVAVSYSLNGFPGPVNVQIQLNKGASYPGGPFNPISNTSYMSGTGSYTFNIPTNVVTGNDYSFMIGSNYPNTESAQWFHTGNFTIIAKSPSNSSNSYSSNSYTSYSGSSVQTASAANAWSSLWDAIRQCYAEGIYCR